MAFIARHRLWAVFLLALICPPSRLFAQPAAPVEPMKNVVEPLPEKPPEWIAGYQLRYTLRVVGDPAASKSLSVVARLPTGPWLRPDGADLAVQAADGTQLPLTVLSHSTSGETLVQFPRHGADQWYYVFAVNPTAPAASGTPLPEGIVLEARSWSGDLSSWTAVREGLAKSEPLVNAFTAEVMQNCNPARQDVPKNYAVTYRGTLNIVKPGVYRFFVNSEDASFLFIDGFKVCDRPGANPRITGRIPLKSIGAELELKAGVHPFELYHALTENPATIGGCLLLWVPPEAKAWAVVPREAFAQPDVAQVAVLEAQGPAVAATIEYGIEETLVAAAGTTVFLARFEAVGELPADENQLKWDFGDGSTGTGRSVRHVYFTAGDYKVSLACGGPLPAYQRRVCIWGAPGDISPFSVAQIIALFKDSDWKSLPPERLDQTFDFLVTCDHEGRWPLLAGLARHRLTQEGLDPKARADLYRALIEAVGRTSASKEMQQVVDQALKEFAKLPTLQVGIELTAAGVWHRQFKDADEAARRYEALLEKHRRIEHPDLRVAAIRWGDLLAESGDLQKAGSLYKTAATLGGDAFLATAQSEAVTRGALLRVAEQKLRTGNILETRQLLDKIELNYPDQKLEGLYRFLRAESDRHAGRYEESLRNYEVLLKLRQWAGYRDKTLHGIADCYFRMDDVPQARKWLAELEKSFPAYFEKEKLAEQKQLLTAREARLEKKPGANGPAAPPAKFQSFSTGFEPEEKEWFGKPENFKFVRGLGLAGPHVALFDSYPVYKGYQTYNRPLPNVSPNGHYWVEGWYREDLFDMQPGFTPHAYFYVYGVGPQLHPTRGQGTYYLERTPGAWRRMGFVLDAPLAQEGRVCFMSLNIAALQIDGLSVRAVTDRELDALSNFIAGVPDEGGE